MPLNLQQRVQTGGITSLAQTRRYRLRHCSSQRVNVRASARQDLVSFPQDYTQVVSQAQVAVKAALANGAKLLEVEFPTFGVQSVQGDGEGANEMTKSLQFLRQFCRVFQDEAGGVRIFFPDEQEMNVAINGKSLDPAAGSWDIEPVFDETRFRLDYLTEPSPLMDFGINLSKRKASQQVQDSDNLIIAAYPHFSPSEMIAVEEVYTGAVRQSGKPMLVFNGEIDRIRTGYYPAFFYPKIGQMAKDFIPKFETCYYIHNFKGSGGGALFRAYPGPWQVFRRDSRDWTEMRLIHTQEEMPTLRQVALEILPRG